MILVSFGSNLSYLGLSPAALVQAAARSVAEIGTGGKLSGLFETPSWPDPSDPPYINAVMRLDGGPAPASFLAALHMIEDTFGRERAYLSGEGKRYAPRTLDLDLLDHQGAIQSGGDGEPVLPHPGIGSRAFILKPLANIAPDWRHPVSGQGAFDMLAALQAVS